MERESRRHGAGHGATVAPLAQLERQRGTAARFDGEEGGGGEHGAIGLSVSGGEQVGARFKGHAVAKGGAPCDSLQRNPHRRGDYARLQRAGNIPQISVKNNKELFVKVPYYVFQEVIIFN